MARVHLKMADKRVYVCAGFSGAEDRGGTARHRRCGQQRRAPGVRRCGRPAARHLMAQGRRSRHPQRLLPVSRWRQPPNPRPHRVHLQLVSTHLIRMTVQIGIWTVSVQATGSRCHGDQLLLPRC